MKGILPPKKFYGLRDEERQDLEGRGTDLEGRRCRTSIGGVHVMGPREAGEGFRGATLFYCFLQFSYLL